MTGKKVEKGDKVRIHYTGTFESGEKFDSSEGREPLEFTVGEGKIIKGFDEEVVSMEVGQEKNIVIQPAEGYGDVHPELIQEVPKNALPDDMREQMKEGMYLRLQDPEGKVIPARVTKVTTNTITVDLNHPLAGKVLKFSIKVEGIVA